MDTFQKVQDAIIDSLLGMLDFEVLFLLFLA